MNRSIVPASTASAPFRATRHDDRSIPSRSASAILRAQRSKAKFGAAVMVPRWREIVSSQRTGLARKASGDIETIGTP